MTALSALCAVRIETRGLPGIGPWWYRFGDQSPVATQSQIVSRPEGHSTDPSGTKPSALYMSSIAILPGLNQNRPL